MSIRLGFIQNEQTAWNQRIERIIAVNQGQLSLYKAADLFFDRFRDRIVKLIEEPMKRYIFHYPDIPPFRAFFKEDGLLVEEQLYLKEVLASELVTLEEFKDFEIRNGITRFGFTQGLSALRIFESGDQEAPRQRIGRGARSRISLTRAGVPD